MNLMECVSEFCYMGDSVTHTWCSTGLYGVVSVVEASTHLDYIEICLAYFQQFGKLQTRRQYFISVDSISYWIDLMNLAPITLLVLD